MESISDNNPLNNSLVCALIIEILKSTDAASILIIRQLSKNIEYNVWKALPYDEDSFRVGWLFSSQGGAASSGSNLFLWFMEHWSHKKFVHQNWIVGLKNAADRDPENPDYSVIDHLSKIRSDRLPSLLEDMCRDDRVDLFKRAPFDLVTTPGLIHHALESCALKILQYMVDNGVSLQNHLQKTSAWYTGIVDNRPVPKMVEYLLRQGFSDVEVNGVAGARANDVPHLRFLMERGINIFKKITLYAAMRSGSFEVVKFLYDHFKQARPAAIDPYGFCLRRRSTFHKAAIQTVQPEMLEWLLARHRPRSVRLLSDWRERVDDKWPRKQPDQNLKCDRIFHMIETLRPSDL